MISTEYFEELISFISFSSNLERVVPAFCLSSANGGWPQ